MKKNTQSADLCADRIDVITNFAFIKRVHCSSIKLSLLFFTSLMRSLLLQDHSEDLEAGQKISL